MTFLGIILSLVPPALWVAWTEAMLLAVVGVGVVSAVALVVVADAGCQADDDPNAAASFEQRRVLADRSMAEIHSVFPLTYHHSLVEKTRFRQAMERVRQLLR
jgi:hypothetical protein